MEQLSPNEHSALARVEHAAMLAQVQKWSAINSGSANLRGLQTMADLLADEFSALPGEVELVSPAAVERVRGDGVIEMVEHGSHLVLTVRPMAPTQLLLTGHMDTVFAADHPFQQQHWLEDGTLNGPGVADMKGGISVMLAALLAFETTKGCSQLGYQVMINSDEEVGSPSSAPLIVQLAKAKLAALTYEPALPDGTLAGERAGSGNFSIIIAGKSAHAGRNPDDGRNALLAAADLALRLKALSHPLLSVNPARIEGGSPNNVVPDHAVLRVNFRPRTVEVADETGSKIRCLIALIETEHGVTAHLHGSFARPPKPIDAGSAKLFNLVKQCGEELGLPINWKSTGGVCDGNNIAACGIPVVDTMGVRGGNIHSAQEFLITVSLVERAQLSALTIMRIAAKGAI